MDDLVWTFVRGSERLVIRRHPQVEEELSLIVQEGGDGRPRVYAFSREEALAAFQSDMESMLLRTGWTLAAFEPDRRTGRDRRGWPRVAPDRRRWWTDGQTRRQPRQVRGRARSGR